MNILNTTNLISWKILPLTFSKRVNPILIKLWTYPTGSCFKGKYLEKIAMDIKSIGNNDFTDHVV